MQCRRHVALLGQLYYDFQKAGASILVILGTTIDRARTYAADIKAPFPILADPDRSIYRLYDLERVMLVQRTASIILDRSGIIRYHKRAVLPHTWLEEATGLINFVQRLPR